MGEDDAPCRSRLIKRYANRKLYDTATSAFTTLHALHSLLLDGVDIAVVDHSTGADRTAEVLNQILVRVQAAEREPDHGQIADMIRAVHVDPSDTADGWPTSA